LEIETEIVRFRYFNQKHSLKVNSDGIKFASYISKQIQAWCYSNYCLQL